MGEYDFTDNLVTISRFRSSTDAALALQRLQVEGIDARLEGDATATSMGHLGADWVGVGILVRQGDYRRAKEILSFFEDEADSDHDSSGSYSADQDYHADDWSGEDWSDTDEDFYEDDLYEEENEEVSTTPALTRAWRAAIIGAVLLPFLVLNIYSMWLIFRFRLWEPQRGAQDDQLALLWFVAVKYLWSPLILGDLLPINTGKISLSSTSVRHPCTKTDSYAAYKAALVSGSRELIEQ